MVGSVEMVSMSLMGGNPRTKGGGGTSRNYALGSGSSTTASVGPARRVWVSLRRAGDPRRGSQGSTRGFSETTGGRLSEAQSLAEHLRVELDEANDRRASVEADLEVARSESASLERQLADLHERLGDSEGQLRSARAQVRQMETELLDLARSKEALREDLPKKAVEEYKESLGFEMGLVRMGHVLLEYGYQLALVRLQARHPRVEIELDPFVTLPKDANVPMADEQPFDNSLLPPEE
ncbi:hypothetical protein BHE74_00047581 [Ensete ventricosum]|nr:hypothetical protein BHE74_00047581 [Ensete ventricosum]